MCGWCLVCYVGFVVGQYVAVVVISVVYGCVVCGIIMCILGSSRDPVVEERFGHRPRKSCQRFG